MSSSTNPPAGTPTKFTPKSPPSSSPTPKPGSASLHSPARRQSSTSPAAASTGTPPLLPSSAFPLGRAPVIPAAHLIPPSSGKHIWSNSGRSGPNIVPTPADSGAPPAAASFSSPPSSRKLLNFSTSNPPQPLPPTPPTAAAGTTTPTAAAGTTTRNSRAVQLGDEEDYEAMSGEKYGSGFSSRSTPSHSSAGSTPSNHGAYSSSASTPSSSISFPASFAELRTGGRQLSHDFEVAASDSTSALDEGETVPAGPGTRGGKTAPLPPKKSEAEIAEELKKDLALIKKAESVAELFTIDCANPKAAVRSTLKMIEQISSQLLSEHAPDDDLFETVTPAHPGRIRYDPYGDKIPIFHRTIPHLLWFEAKPPKRPGFPADIQVLLMPYWVFPAPPDNSCVPTSLARALQPESMLSDLACSTFLPKDTKGAFGKIKAFREKCGKFMDDAAAGRKERTAQFVQLCNVFGFDAAALPEPAKTDKGKDAQTAKDADWQATFQKKRDQIAGTDAVVAEDFAALVAWMEGCYVQQCTYRSTIDSDVAQFRPDCDFPEGLVTSGLVGQRWSPNQESTKEVPLFEGSEPVRTLTFLHYLRHFHEEEIEQRVLLPAPAKTDDEFEKMLKDVRLGRVHGVGHCEPMLPATNFVNQSVSNPAFRCDPAMWAPVLHMAKCRYFFTPYHVYRKIANGSEFELARIGSVLDLPEGEKTVGTFVVLATFVRLSSKHWNSARDHQQQQIVRSLDLAATADEKKEGEAATHAKQVLDDVAGRPTWDPNWDPLSPIAMVVLARINLAAKPKRKDLQAELTRIGVASEGKVLPDLDIQVLAMLDVVINKKGQFREIEDYDDVPAKGRKKGTVALPEDAGKVQVFVKSTLAEIQAEKGKKRPKKKSAADDKPVTRCLLDDTIVPLQLDWPARLTDAAVDAIWDSGLKDQVAEASGPSGLERLDGAPLSVDELHEEFLEEVSAKAMLPFDERPLRLIRTVFTDACPWEHQFPLCGEGDVPLQEEQEAQLADKQKKPSELIPFTRPKAGASERDWDHAYERYLRNFTGDEATWPKGTMAGRWKALAKDFFEPANIFRNLVAGFKAEHPEETNPSTIGCWIKQETRTRDPQLYLHLHLSPKEMPECRKEIQDPEGKWRQASYLKTIPRIDSTLLNFDPPAKHPPPKDKEEVVPVEESDNAKSNGGKKKNGKHRPVIELSEAPLSDKEKKAQQQALEKAAAAAEAEKQAAAKRAAAKRKEEKKIEAAKKAKEPAKEAEEFAVISASSPGPAPVRGHRGPPRHRLADPQWHASPLRSPSPAPKRQRHEESREFQEMKEQLKQMQAVLRAALPVPTAPVAPIFAPAPVAPIFAPAPVALVPTSAVVPSAAAAAPAAAAAAPSLTAQQIQQARDFAGSDPAKFAQYCQWLQSAAATSPRAAPAASIPAAPAPAAFSPAFLQQATQFAGTDAPKFDHFLSLANQMRSQLAPPAAAAAASSSLSVPMEDIIQIVHRTLDAQQRSPAHRRDDRDLLQQFSGYTHGRESGMQEMAWAQQEHQAAMMRGYFMRR